jgi:D-threonate/D-erythronate kinase
MSNASFNNELGSPRSGQRWGMIADDLTGACDAGVQFAARGFSAIVRLAPECKDAAACNLLATATNSRNDAPEVARAKVARACHELINEGREIVYKKIDSTLRGNIAAEIETVMEICGQSLAFFTPAFPAAGRTVTEGWLRVASSSPASRVHLPTLLREQGFENVVHLDRAALGKDSRALIERLDKISAAEKTAVALDAGTDDDLAVVVRAGIEMRGRAILAGSAGLAAAFAAVLAEQSRRISTPPTWSARSTRNTGTVVFILGSTHPVTKAQIGFLIRNRPVISFEPNSNSSREALAAAKKGCALLVPFDPARDDPAPLEEFLRALVDSPLCGVTLSGGDTAWAVCRTLGTAGIKLEREIVAGIPCGRLIGGLADGVAVVTKAGGFGGENALAAIADFLALYAPTTT